VLGHRHLSRSRRWLGEQRHCARPGERQLPTGGATRGRRGRAPDAEVVLVSWLVEVAPEVVMAEVELAPEVLVAPEVVVPPLWWSWCHRW
jgi:hypothetical protein